MRFPFPSILFFLLLGLSLQTTAPVVAEPRELKTGSSDKLDAVVVLDSSGSMLSTDPTRLRDEGVKLLSQFLSEGDNLGLIEFSDAARILRPLSPYNKSQESEIASSLTSIANQGEYTDLLAGLVLARGELARLGRPDAKKVIMLLSDGKMDPNPAVGTTAELSKEIISTQLPELKSVNVRVYTLSFSENADKDFLAQIAMGTDGEHWFTPSVEKVHESFADLFLAVKRPQVLNLHSVGDKGRGFKIDSGVQEATFYINRDEKISVEIEAPNGKRFTSSAVDPTIRWFQSQKFDVVTLSEPQAGDWKVMGLAGDDGFATILTNLKLQSAWPNIVFEGQEVLLEAQLYEGEKPVSLPKMSGAVRFGFQVTPVDRVAEPVIREFLVDDGTRGDKVAQDGIFSHRLTLEQEGEYRLKVLASGPTFERSQQVPFRVRPRLVKLLVEENFDTDEISLSSSAENVSSEDPKEEVETSGTVETSPATTTPTAAKFREGKFKIILSSDALNLREIEVELDATDAEKARFALPLTKLSANTYEVPISALPNVGKYRLEAKLNGRGAKNRYVSERSNVVQYLYNTDEPKATKVVVAVQQDVPPKPWPAWPFLLLVMVTNATMSFVLMRRYQSYAQQTKVELPPLDMPREISAGIEDLEKRATEADLDLKDKRFYGDAPVPLPPGLVPEGLAEEAPVVTEAVVEAPPEPEVPSTPPEGT